MNASTLGKTNKLVIQRLYQMKALVILLRMKETLIWVCGPPVPLVGVAGRATVH
jgi:hypothetical protein